MYFIELNKDPYREDRGCCFNNPPLAIVNPSLLLTGHYPYLDAYLSTTAEEEYLPNAPLTNNFNYAAPLLDKDNKFSSKLEAAAD